MPLKLLIFFLGLPVWPNSVTYQFDSLISPKGDAKIRGTCEQKGQKMKCDFIEARPLANRCELETAQYHQTFILENQKWLIEGKTLGPSYYAQCFAWMRTELICTGKSSCAIKRDYFRYTHAENPDLETRVLGRSIASRERRPMACTSIPDQVSVTFNAANPDASFPSGCQQD